MNHGAHTRVVAADQGGILLGAELLAAGSLVGFPTETVYGLGADATNSEAVRAIFTAKGRPATDPLIVHVTGGDAAERFAELGPGSAVVRQLIEAFWPGPLTVVVPRRNDGVVPAIAPEVSQLDTIALRCPANEIALALIDAAGVPVAAPSANRFGRVSPTTAAHVVAELDGVVPLVLDGGPTRFGVESTVVVPRGDALLVLRPGAVPVESIQDLVGHDRVEVLDSVAEDHSLPAESPGTSVSHYAPDVRVLLTDSRHTTDGLTTALESQGVKIGHLVLPAPEQAAPMLYGALRDLDDRAIEEALDAVTVELVDPAGIGRAVNDRLLRAAEGHLVVAVDEGVLRSVMDRIATRRARP